MSARKRLVDSFNYAIAGIIYAFSTQRNMRIHMAMALLVLVLSLWFRISTGELLVLFFAISMVIVAEMFNTALEAAVDLYIKTYHPLAKIAKNVAAGAVLVASLNALVVGYIIFFQHLNPITLWVVERVRQSPIDVTFIALIIVTILVVIFKAFGKRGTFLEGGLPSGHTALAFAAATALTLISKNTIAATLGLFMAVLVAHSRHESGIHSALEVLSGALLGLVSTVLIFQLLQ